MIEEGESKNDGFLNASQLIKEKGIGYIAWEDWQHSNITLPKTGKKYFEPTGSWLQEKQLENGLRNQRRLLQMERVDRSAQLALAEWLPGIQKAKVIKKSGQRWDCFGTEDKGGLYLLPEETLLLLEMNCLEVTWNGMPLSIQQAYEIMINSENSKCSLDEFRVYSHLVRGGYKLQRFRDKLSLDNKSTNKRIIMNPDGLWTPNTSPTMDIARFSNDSSDASKSSDDQKNDFAERTDKSENDSSPKKLGIVSEETVLGEIKILKSNSLSSKDLSTLTTPQSQVPKWPGSRIQRNVKLMPKRNDKPNITNSNLEVTECLQDLPTKRKNSISPESAPPKKPRPEVIELSDDEIEEIPRPMSRLEILNTFPNLAGKESIVAEISRSYIPHGVKPAKDFYRFNRQDLLKLTETDSMLRRNMQQIVPINNVQHNGQSNHFYSQQSQCHQTTYGTNNGYPYRGMGCQRGSYIQQNVSHNTIVSPFSGTVFQSNYINFVMEVMGNKVRSFRQQQFHQTTFCQNLQIISPREHMNYYSYNPREQYYRRGIGGCSGSQMLQAPTKGRGYSRYPGEYNRPVYDEVNQPAFTKRPGVTSWAELKSKWLDESTITIEDEEPQQNTVKLDSNEVQVVEESVSPLISCKSGSISNISEVYARLQIIKSASDRTVRSRKMHYNLSYEVFPINQHYRKAFPGPPMCRVFIVNTKKDACMDASKLQRLQQESKDVPIIVAFVSQSCISFVQPGGVRLPNYV